MTGGGQCTVLISVNRNFAEVVKCLGECENQKAAQSLDVECETFYWCNQGGYMVCWSHCDFPCHACRMRCSTYAHGHPLSLSVRRKRSNSRFWATLSSIHDGPIFACQSRCTFVRRTKNPQAQSAWQAMIRNDGSSSADKAMPKR